MTRICALWRGLVFVIPCVAQARQARDFARLRLEVGDVVFVTDRVSGEGFSGVLTSLTPASLVVAGRMVTPRPGLTIERRGDPVREGAVIAGVVGAIVGVQVGHEACFDRSKWWCAAQAGIYAAMGALYDAMHVGRTTVYRSSARPSVAFRAGHTISPNALAPVGTTSGSLQGGGPRALAAVRVSVPLHRRVGLDLDAGRKGGAGFAIAATLVVQRQPGR